MTARASVLAFLDFRLSTSGDWMISSRTSSSDPLISRVDQPPCVVLGDHLGDLGEGGMYHGDPGRQGDDRAGDHGVLPLQVVLEEVDRHVDRREEFLEVRERHGTVRRHGLMATDPVEVALGFVEVLPPAPVPRHEEVELHPWPVEPAFEHVYPVTQRAP